jgi:hypothetical protein
MKRLGLFLIGFILFSNTAIFAQTKILTIDEAVVGMWRE